MRNPSEIKGSNRLVAWILAAVWLLSGLGAVLVGIMTQYRLGLLLGPLAVGYGALWVRVAWTGRRYRA